MQIATGVVLFLLIQLLSGCGRLSSMLDEVVPDQRKDYTRARTLPDLSIPPGLSTDAIRDKMAIPEESPEGERAFSDFQDRVDKKKPKNLLSSDSLANGDSIVVAEISTLDDQHVIVVEATRYELWEKIKYFWRAEGYEFELDDPDLGVLETVWLEDKNGLVRNRYKIFIENGKDEGTIIVFLSHQKQDLIQTEQAYGEDYEWGEIGFDEKLQAATVDRLKNSLESQVPSYAASDSDQNEDSSTLNPDVYDPAKSFANKMSPRKMRPARTLSADDKTTTKERQPPSLGVAKDSSANKTEAPPYSPSDDFAEKMSPRKMTSSALTNTREKYPAVASIEAEATGIRMVSVGRGKYYLTLESDFSSAWKSTKEALRVANVSVRKADKGRGIFVVDLIETGYGESTGWNRIKFWKTNEASQYQVSVTGIGDKTEVVILDPDGRWITSHEAERLLDRIYNALMSQS